MNLSPANQVLVTTYLEMHAVAELHAAYSSDPTLTILESMVPLVPFYRFLYGEVGRQWRWFDRNEWSDEKLEAHLAQPTIRVYVLYVSGTPAGYVELEQQSEGNTEVAYFGLIEKFFGRGYGKHLLSFGIQRAWDLGARRVWVHTCSLDGPYALPNYESRGFKVYDVTEAAMPEKYMTPSAG